MNGGAIVVGAGISGLTAALALRRCGWRVRVLERTPGPRASGAGILLQPNALHALDAVGAGQAVRAAGTSVHVGNLVDESGRRLSRVDPERMLARFGHPTTLVLRPRLQQVLLETLAGPDVETGMDPVTVEYGVDVGGAEPGDDARRAVVHLADGDRMETDLVVGADGIRSRLRPVVAPDAPEPAYVGSTAWLGVTSGPAVDALLQTWGPGGEFGMSPVGDGRLFWNATAADPPGSDTGDPEAELARLRRQFAGWHDPIPDVIARTRPDELFRFDLFALPRPLSTFARGRIALVGDAAHAMPPHLGQGGCQGIEDGVVLAHSVTHAPAVPDGLAEYDATRRPRTSAVLKGAWAAARGGEQQQRRLPVVVRNTVMRRLPQSVMVWTMARFAGWRPPHLRAS